MDSQGYVALAKNAIFKSRYGKWYLIDTAKRERTRLLAEGGTENVLLELFRGQSLQEVAGQFDLPVGDLESFIAELMGEGVVEYRETRSDSTAKCFDVDPPLDSLNALITNVCNLRCTHCYVESGLPMRGELTGDEWIGVLMEARQLGVFEINISGGEATLHPEFEKIAEHIGSVPTFNANLNTNAVFLRPGIEALIARCFKTVQVSLDDAEAQKHDAFRGKAGSFASSLANIARLRAAGIETNVGFTLTRGNLHSLDAVVSLCENIGISVLNIGFVADQGRAASNGLVQIVTRESLRDDEYITEMYEKLQAISRRESPTKILLPFRVGDGNRRTTDKVYICDGDNTQILYAMPDGSLMPCDKLPIGQFAYGNVRQGGLIGTWVSSRMKEFKLMRPTQLAKCGGCPHLTVCGGACVARAYQAGGTLDSPDWMSCVIAQKFAGQ